MRNIFFWSEEEYEKLPDHIMCLRDLRKDVSRLVSVFLQLHRYY